MFIFALSFVIVVTGLGVGYWRPVKEWFQGGVPQISVAAENRGLARHSIAYVQANGGRVRRPIRNGSGVRNVYLAGLRAAEMAA
jgi:hypothetical protein